MIRCTSFLSDAFFAFFGFVTGRDFGYAPGYAVLGGVLLIGGLMLLFLIASLIAQRVKISLPSEEGEDAAGKQADADPSLDISPTKDASATLPQTGKGNGASPENTAPRGAESVKETDDGTADESRETGEK